MQYDLLIVGSGLYGATFAHEAAKRGKRVLVIDKRNHLGGNVYCKDIEGIHVHAYGAHIFHTSNEEVWRYVNSLVPFNRYTNCPIANYQGKLYNLPFNMNTFYELWGVKTPEEAKAVVASQREMVEKRLATLGRSEPMNLEEQALLLVGRDIYEKLIKGYTEKQWGRPCTDLPPSLIRRLPVRYTFDNNYFNDRWQGIPIGGYSKLIHALLKGIPFHLEKDYLEEKSQWDALAKKVVYTGALDAYFGFCYGKLAWRSVRFKEEILQEQNYQGVAVVNYTEKDVPYTRIIEHKHFEKDNPSWEKPITVISKEFSEEWKDGSEPFYPVGDQANLALAEKYKALMAKENHVFFGGRLADYRYYDMDDVIAKALEASKRILT